MVMKMYSIYDIKTGIFYPPMVCHNVAHAMREYTQVFTGNNQFSKFPADYNVHEIGTFDDQSSKVTGVDQMPIAIFNGEELVLEARKAVKANHGSM